MLLFKIIMLFKQFHNKFVDDVMWTKPPKMKVGRIDGTWRSSSFMEFTKHGSRCPFNPKQLTLHAQYVHVNYTYMRVSFFMFCVWISHCPSLHRWYTISCFFKWECTKPCIRPLYYILFRRFKWILQRAVLQKFPIVVMLKEMTWCYVQRPISVGCVVIS